VLVSERGDIMKVTRLPDVLHRQTFSVIND